MCPSFTTVTLSTRSDYNEIQVSMVEKEGVPHNLPEHSLTPRHPTSTFLILLSKLLLE